MTPTRDQIIRWMTPEKLIRIFGKLQSKKTNHAQGSPYCWIWTGRKNDGGYAELSFTLDRKRYTVQIHRLLYVFFWGDIKDSAKIRHAQCGDRACCNPLHHMPGTTRDNAEDAARDGTIGRRRSRKRAPVEQLPEPWRELELPSGPAVK